MYVINTKEMLLEQLKGTEDIYIYGAGKVGSLVFVLLQEYGIQPKAFFVTKESQNMCMWGNTPIYIYDFSRLTSNSKLIIAALGRNQEEILENSIEINNRLIISDSFFERYYSNYVNLIQSNFEREQLTIYRRVAAEEKLYKNAFDDMVEDNECFKARFKTLIKGLDQDSIEILERCVKRIRLLKLSDEFRYDFFTKDEKERILKGKAFVEKGKTQIKEDVWSLNGDLLPVNDFRVELFYDKLGVEKITNIDCCKNKDIIDVGGYIGDSALVLSKFSHKKIHVFEPMEKGLQNIKRTKELNQLNVKENFAAVSSRNEKTTFSVCEREYLSGLTRIGDREYTKQIMIDVVTIDKYVADYQLEIGLIKIHAEGAEQDVIKGAEKTIREQSPIIIVEINHTESDFFDIKPMLERINPKYRFKVFKPSNSFVCLGIKLIAEVL